MRNVTISLDDDLLKECRAYARQNHTTLNALIRRKLTESVSERSSAWVDELFANMDRAHANSGGWRWKRAELYDA